MAKFYENVKYSRFYESNFWGTVEVIDRRPKELKVKFLESGNEYWFLSANVLKGKISDSIRRKKEVDSWRPHKEVLVNNSGEEFIAFSKKRDKFKILFPSNGYTAEVFIENARKGKVNNPYSITVYGKGYLGEFNNKLPYWKQVKQLWQNMMKRCYSDKDPRGYRGRAFVSDRWLCFANFLEDVSGLDSFDKWLEAGKGGATKYNLDKDSLIAGNNVYAKHLCVFLTESENKSLGKKGKKKKDWEGN